MNVTYEEAQEKLRAWTETPSLLKHARAVEVVMRRAASQYGGGNADGANNDGCGADEEAWAIVGLLHDADYERWPDEHPAHIVYWLAERGEHEAAHAIAAHAARTGVEPNATLDNALLACDELAGFVVACSLVRPEGVATLKPKSVKKKLKDKSFAAKVDRGEIARGVELLGVDLTEHIQFVIDALKPHADELGIGGQSIGGQAAG